MTALVDAIVVWPLPARLAILAIVGAVLGRWINRGIYRLARYRRGIGPWDSETRKWLDWAPIVGWLSLARESTKHGGGFWIRPMLIELFVAAGLPLLYWWEISGGLIPASFGLSNLGNKMQYIAHAQFAAHAVLFSLLIVATFIDFDERLIPDAITVPGAVFGLVWSAIAPMSLLVSAIPTPAAGAGPSHLWITTPTAEWPSELNGPVGLAIGLTCLAGWIFALFPAMKSLGNGPGFGVKVFAESVRRRFLRKRRRRTAVSLAAILIFGGIGIVAVWSLDPAKIPWHWQSLLSSLVGMAAGGALVWAVRIIGSAALGQEAMGFGDVTLMAMIGAFVGWQGALLVFFLAPFAALLIAAGQYIFIRDNALAFGPYLCLAALVLIVGWSPIWNDRASPIFTLGWYLPGIVVFCLALMGGMLWGISGLRRRDD
jgi:leader peptidase (prepilin peptidase)/N-methyltransferase